jgi:hypothetical protein
MCRSIVSSLTDPASIAEWFHFLQTPSSAYSAPPTPTTSTSQSGSSFLYGPAAHALRDLLFHHIASTLPVQLAAFSSSALPPHAAGAQPNLLAQAHASGPGASASGQAHLVQIYALLPFSLFKAVMESADFPPGDMERFSFAKKCIAERKRLQGKDAGVTETAVLAFGSAGAGSSNVEIVAKQKKGQRLWKVGEQ